MKRYGGDDRYGTSLAVIENLYGGNASTLAVATGKDYPDALVGAVLAGKSGGAILLADGTAAALPEKAASVIGATGRTWILGGTSAVAEGLEDEIIRAMK